MPGETITVLQLCGVCRSEVGTFEIKKDNLMLSSRARVWCAKCGSYTPEVRDIAGRVASIQREVDSLPAAGGD